MKSIGRYKCPICGYHCSTSIRAIENHLKTHKNQIMKLRNVPVGMKFSISKPGTGGQNWQVSEMGTKHATIKSDGGQKRKMKVDKEVYLIQNDTIKT